MLRRESPMLMLRTLLQLALGKRLPTIDGSLRLNGVHAPIKIRRDEHGIPYVEASSDDDAFFGVGFCQAQDRAFQLELYVRVARGTLAEVLGEDMLPVDRLMRRIGFVGIARAQVAALDAPVRAQLEAFARGVNAGLAHGAAKLPHELTMLGLKKASTFAATDVLAVLQFFAFALSSNWDAELARLRILQADGEEALAALEASDPAWTRSIGGHVTQLALDAGALLAVATQLADDASTLAKIAPVGGASNAWAVAPSRTTTGRAILACDPHLSPALPSHWYLVHVRTPTWAMRGACLPSQPVATFGHSEHLAWGITAGHVDNTDLFVERVSPDGTSVREGDDNRWRPCEVREEVIAVKGKPSVTERVLITPRGPIVSPCIGGDDVALSMRGTWMAPRRIGGYEIRNARNVDEACAVYASYPATSENRVFADTTGRIAWHMIGDAPVRKKGAGMLPAPGWDQAYGWEDAPLPYDALPHAIDPPSGYVVTANAYPGASPPPYENVFLGADWLDGSRQARITEILDGRRDWDVGSTMLVQIDRKTMVWPRIRGVVLDAARTDHIAARLLERWDGVVSPSSAAASVFELFFAEMMVRVAKAKAPKAWRAVIGEGTNVLLPHGIMSLRRVDHLARLLIDQPAGFFPRGWRVEMVAAITEAMRTLVSTAGDDEGRWGWGHVRPLFLVHPMGQKPPLDRIWNRGPLAFGGDATTIPQASVVFDAPLGNAIGVPNLRAVFDVGNWEDCRFVLAGGESGNPLSPHYDDMLDRWLRGEGITMGWSPESVAERARSVLEILPG